MDLSFRQSILKPAKALEYRQFNEIDVVLYRRHVMPSLLENYDITKEHRVLALL